MDGVGDAVGWDVGVAVGSGVGDAVGSGLGVAVGSGVGVAVGSGVGDAVGSGVDAAVGLGVGEAVGSSVGDAEGETLGPALAEASGLALRLGSGDGEDPLEKISASRPPRPSRMAYAKIRAKTAMMIATHHLLTGSSMYGISSPPLATGVLGGTVVVPDAGSSSPGASTGESGISPSEIASSGLFWSVMQRNSPWSVFRPVAGCRSPHPRKRIPSIIAGTRSTCRTMRHEPPEAKLPGLRR
jgi:hypothetical protein